MGALRQLPQAAKAGEDRFKGAPYFAPMQRLNETQAARSPILSYSPPDPAQQASE